MTWRGLWLVASFGLLCCVVPPVQAADVTAPLVATTTVKLSAPDTDFGAAPTLDALYNSGSNPSTVPVDVREGLMKFSLAPIPKGMYIVSAKLTLTGEGTSQSGYGDVRLRAVTSAWDNATTWNTRPSYDSASVVNMEVNNNTFPSSVDITPLVQEWYAGTVSNNGLVMRVFGDADYKTGLYDFEDVHISSMSGANPPQLTVTYSNVPPSPTPAPKQSTATPTASSAPVATASSESGSNTETSSSAGSSTAPDNLANPLSNPPVTDKLQSCAKDIRNLQVKRSEASFDITFTTQQPVFGEGYLYSASRTTPPNSLKLAQEYAKNADFLIEKQSTTTHHLVFLGLLPGRTYYYTLFAGPAQECEHAGDTIQPGDPSVNILSKISKGSQAINFSKPPKKENSLPLAQLAQTAANVLTGGEPVAPVVWGCFVLAVLTLFTLGRTTNQRLRQVMMGLRNIPNRWRLLNQAKKPRGTWGRVMSSLSMKAIPDALVSLYKVDGKTVVDRVVTDERGLYGFHAEPGVYTLTVGQPSYTFPPILMPYAYQGTPVKVESLDGVTQLDIAMDPSALTDTSILRHEALLLRLSLLRLPLLVFGTLLGLYAVITILTVVAFIPLLGFMALAYREVKAGPITNYCVEFKTANGQPVSFAQATVRSAKTRTVVSRVINKQGQVLLSVPPGEYSAEITTFPTPERPTITHTRVTLDLRPARTLQSIVCTI